MDLIPYIEFIGSLMVFGLCKFLYNPVVTWLNTEYSTASFATWATVMFWIWGALAGIWFFIATIRLLKTVTKRWKVNE